MRDKLIVHAQSIRRFQNICLQQFLNIFHCFLENLLIILVLTNIHCTLGYCNRLYIEHNYLHQPRYAGLNVTSILRKSLLMDTVIILTNWGVCYDKTVVMHCHNNPKLIDQFQPTLFNIPHSPRIFSCQNIDENSHQPISIA